jgi:hypothetical protein
MVAIGALTRPGGRRSILPGMPRRRSVLPLKRALPLVAGVYALAIVPALAVTDWTTWTDGAWPAIAQGVAGPWLAAWIALAGMVSAALALEFAALIRLRRSEPELRGSFRVPAQVPALIVLAAMPMLLIVAAVALEAHSRDIGLVGVAVAALFGAMGPIWYAARSSLKAQQSRCRP